MFVVSDVLIVPGRVFIGLYIKWENVWYWYWLPHNIFIWVDDAAGKLDTYVDAKLG